MAFPVVLSRIKIHGGKEKLFSKTIGSERNFIVGKKDSRLKPFLVFHLSWSNVECKNEKALLDYKTCSSALFPLRYRR